MVRKLQDYVEAADPQDLHECLLENLRKHSKSHFNMISELYYNDKAHFDQLSAGCKAAAIIYLIYVNSTIYTQEGIDAFMESL